MAVLATIIIFSLCYAEEPLGDVNGDCRVNLVDAIELLQGRIPCEQGDCPCCPELGDVNGDGQVDELDGVYLLQHFFNHVPLLDASAADIQLTRDVQPTLKMYSPLS